MAAAFWRKVNKSKFRRRLVFIILLVLFLYNLDTLARLFYPLPYREPIFHYAGVYELDPFLLAAMIKTESGFDPRAVSVSGARGLMQIMPETGQWIARQTGDPSFKPEILFDPDTSIRYGTWYVADLKREFGRDAVLVLAAYNAGRGNVREWLSSRQIRGVQDIDQIPYPETRHYVRKVLLRQKIYSYLYGREAPGASLFLAGKYVPAYGQHDGA